MAENTNIDTLELQVQSNATQAVKSLGEMVTALNSVKSALSGINFDNFKQFSNIRNEIKNISEPVSELKKNVENLKITPAVDTQKLKRSLEDINKNFQAKYQDLGKGFEIKGNFQQIEKQLISYTNNLEKARLTQKELELSGNFNSKAYETATKNVIKYTNIVSSLNSQLESLKTVADGADDSLSRITITDHMRRAPMTLQELTEKAVELNEELQYLNTAGHKEGMIADLERYIKEVQTNFPQAIDLLQEFKLILDEVNATKVKEPSVGVNKESLKSLDWLRSNVRMSREEFEGLLEKLRVPITTNVKISNIDAAKKKLENLQQTKEKLEYQKSRDVDLGKIKFDDNAFRAYEVKIQETESQIQQLSEAIKSAEDGANRISFAGFIAALSQLNSNISQVGNVVRSVFDSIKSFANSLKSVFSKVNDFRKGIQGLIGTNKKSDDSFKVALRTIIKYGFGVRSLYFLFRRFRSAIKEGYENLAQYSAEMNTSISSMSSALTRLKNAFAVAFAPIVNVIAPYITMFINMLADALNAVGRFFSALTGKSYAVQATKVMQDYAASLDSATGSAKKLEKELSVLGFDELNQLSKPSESGSGGGGGNGAEVAVKDMFDTVELEGDSWADRIRKEFLDHDWEGLGAEIADGLNRGLQKIYAAISWETVGPKITAFTSAFTQTLNSLTTNFDWGSLGKTIGAGLNTSINTLNSLIGEGGIDFSSIGSGIASALRSAIEEIDWAGIGNFIGNKFMIAWNMLSGFVIDLSKTDDAGLSGWDNIGIALGNAINGAFQKINFGQIGLTLASGFNGLVDVLKNATLTINWEDVATNISTGINNFIQNVDWEDAGATLSDFIKTLLGTFRSVAEQTDWEAIGQAIGDFLGSIDWAGIIGEVGGILWDAFSGIISGLFDTSSGKVILAIGGGMLAIKGILAGTDAIKSVVQFGSSVLGVFQSIFGPATGIVALVAGAAILIIANWDKIKQAASSLVTWLSEKWTWVKEKLSGVWNNIKTTASNAWTNIKNTVVNVWNSLVSFASTTFGRIRDTISGAWNFVGGIVDKLGQTFSDAKQSAKDAVRNIIDSFTNIHIPLPHFTFGSKKKDILGFSIDVPTVDIDWYKKGGLFDGPQVIGVGEDGREAVLPMENKRTMSMLANSIMANMPNGVQNDQALTNAVARGFALAMMNNQQSGSTPQYLQNSIYLDGEAIARVMSRAQSEKDYRYNPSPQFG